MPSATKGALANADMHWLIKGEGGLTNDDSTAKNALKRAKTYLFQLISNYVYF